MKYVKTILAAFLALCLILGLAAPVFATEATETTGATAESTAAATEDTAADATEEDIADPTEAVTDGTDGDADDTTTTGVEEHEEEVPENPVRKAIRIVLIVLEVIASIILIVVILMQSGKESGLSSTISGNSDSYLSKNGLGSLDKKLSKATKWVALVWVVLTLLLSIV